MSGSRGGAAVTARYARNAIAKPSVMPSSCNYLVMPYRANAKPSVASNVRRREAACKQLPLPVTPGNTASSFNFSLCQSRQATNCPLQATSIAAKRLLFVACPWHNSSQNKKRLTSQAKTCLHVSLFCSVKVKAAWQIRTADLILTKDALYQLS